MSREMKEENEKREKNLNNNKNKVSYTVHIENYSLAVQQENMNDVLGICPGLWM